MHLHIRAPDYHGLCDNREHVQCSIFNIVYMLQSAGTRVLIPEPAAPDQFWPAARLEFTDLHALLVLAARTVTTLYKACSIIQWIRCGHVVQCTAAGKLHCSVQT